MVLQRALTGAATFFLIFASMAGPAVGAEDKPAAKPWSGSAGLAFLATSGNTDTQTLGLDLAFKRVPEPWGLEVTASYLRAEDSGLTTAERYGAKLRGQRAFSERWAVFAGLSGERDTFSGYDLRGIVEAGGTYTVLPGPTHTLAIDGGLTWTKEDLVTNRTNNSLGALAGLSYTWKPREGTQLSERLVWYPNFDETGNWRATSETAFQAALSERLAVKLSYEVRHYNQPVPGFDKTDTTTKASLVATF